MDRCPYYKRKVKGKYFSGICCGSDERQAQTLGNWPVGKWNEQQRNEKLKKHCYDQYGKCQMFKQIHNLSK